MTDAAQEALAPCPFCGGAATKTIGGTTEIIGHSYWVIGCYFNTCKVSPVFYAHHMDEAEAISAWNTRAIQPELDALRAELERVKSHLREVSKAVTGLTVGAGSEYFVLVGDEYYVDSKAITERIGERLNDGRDARVELAKARKELAAVKAKGDALLRRAAVFVEALADNDPDEPIADNGMTVLGKLQYDAPELAWAIRATLAAWEAPNG